MSNDMQKKSLEALKAQRLTAGENQTPVEGERQSVHVLAAIPFLGIDPILVGASGYTGFVTSLADREMREHNRMENSRRILMNRIHDAIDDFYNDAGPEPNALLMNTVDYRLLMCKEAFVYTELEQRRYRGLQVIQSFDMPVGQVRVGYLK